MVYYIPIALKVSWAGKYLDVNVVTIIFQMAQRYYKDPFFSYQQNYFILILG